MIDKIPERPSHPNPACDAAALALLQEANAFANVRECLLKCTLQNATVLNSFDPVFQFGLIISHCKASMWLQNEVVALLQVRMFLDLLPFMTKRGGVLTNILKF